MYTLLQGPGGRDETEHQTLAAALTAMKKSKTPCRIECEARGNVEWEKWHVRSVGESFFQYISPQGKVITDEELEVLIDVEKENLVDGVNMN